jgi:hypothetical protein
LCEISLDKPTLLCVSRQRNERKCGVVNGKVSPPVFHDQSKDIHSIISIILLLLDLNEVECHHAVVKHLVMCAKNILKKRSNWLVVNKITPNVHWKLMLNVVCNNIIRIAVGPHSEVVAVGHSGRPS